MSIWFILDFIITGESRSRYRTIEIQIEKSEFSNTIKVSDQSMAFEAENNFNLFPRTTGQLTNLEMKFRNYGTWELQRWIMYNRNSIKGFILEYIEMQMYKIISSVRSQVLHF